MPGSTIANQLLRPQNSWKGWSDVNSGGSMTHLISATLDSGSTLYTVIGAFAVAYPTPAPTISHPFETGDIVYSVVSGSNPDIRYVINVSSTQFRLASSLSNATAGTALTLGDVTITTDPTSNFTNVTGLYAKFALNLFSASAKSTQAFNINVPVRIDWNTAGNTNVYQNNGIVAGLWVNATTYYMMTTNVASNFLYSGAILGNGSGITYPSGFPYGTYDTSYKGRIIITPSRTIEFWMARNIANPTYTLVYTQSALATNTPPLYFVAGFCLKNQRIENCTITYL
jgi:hypothetical protein